MKHLIAQAALSTGIAILATPTFAGWVTLNNPPATPIMTTCGNGTTTAATCNAGSVSTATTGFSLLASTRRDINAQGVLVGYLYDAAYYNSTTDEVILGIRLDMNANEWDPPSDETFEVNDVFRRGFSSVSTLYGGYSKVNVGDEHAREIGRTDVGLNEGTVAYDLDWVRWHTDVNVDDPDGTSPATSAWYWVKFTGAIDVVEDEEAIRVWQGGEEGQEPYSAWLSGYVPVFASARSAMALAPVPEPSEYAMLLAGLGLVGVMARRRMR